jgi:hypothetical protein
LISDEAQSATLMPVRPDFSRKGHESEAKMAKNVKITKTSFQLGWIDGIERKAGRCLIDGVDSEAYARGVKRAGEFRRRIAIRPDADHDADGSGVHALERSGR